MKFSSGFNYRVACLKAFFFFPLSLSLFLTHPPFVFKHGKLYQNFPRTFILPSTISRFLEHHKQKSLATPFYQRVLSPTVTNFSTDRAETPAFSLGSGCVIFLYRPCPHQTQERDLILTVFCRDGTVFSLISNKEIKAIHTHAQNLLTLEITSKKIAWFSNVSREPSINLIRSPKDIEERRRSIRHTFFFSFC